MPKQIVISESDIYNMVMKSVKEYITEGRKVLKLGGNSQGDNMGMPPQSPMPPMDNSMDIGEDPNGGMSPMEQDGMNGPIGGDGATTGDSDFDTNFDAGVEADEDTDPKKYIQQLTGKLSQSLSKYNNDNGMDVGLCKYVANMIIKQAAKGLDEKDRKDIIKAINTTAEDNSDEMPEGGDEEENMGDELDMSNEEMPPMDDEKQNIQERYLTKKDLKRIVENIGCTDCEREEKSHPIENIKNKPKAFIGKTFR